MLLQVLPNREAWSSWLQLIPSGFPIWAPLTSLFMHASWSHLVGNIVGLLMFYFPLELRIRARESLIVVWVAACVGNLGQAMFTSWLRPDLANQPQMGLSTLVFGALGLCAVRFAHVGVTLGKLKVPVIPICAVMIAVQQLGILMSSFAEGQMHIGYAGHLLAFVFAVGMAYAFGIDVAATRLVLLRDIEASRQHGDLINTAKLCRQWAVLEPDSAAALLAAARSARDLADLDTAHRYYRAAEQLLRRQMNTAAADEVLREARL